MPVNVLSIQLSFFPLNIHHYLRRTILVTQTRVTPAEASPLKPQCPTERKRLKHKQPGTQQRKSPVTFWGFHLQLKDPIHSIHSGFKDFWQLPPWNDSQVPWSLWTSRIFTMPWWPPRVPWNAVRPADALALRPSAAPASTMPWPSGPRLSPYLKGPQNCHFHTENDAKPKGIRWYWVYSQTTPQFRPFLLNFKVGSKWWHQKTIDQWPQGGSSTFCATTWVLQGSCRLGPIRWCNGHGEFQQDLSLMSFFYEQTSNQKLPANEKQRIRN